MNPAHWLARFRARRLAVAVLAAGVAFAQDGAPSRQPTATVQWKYAPPGSDFEEVLARGDTVFALDRAGAIHAIDAASGVPRWKTGKLGLDFTFGIALAERPDFHALLVGSDDGFSAFDRTTGKRLWHTP